MFRVEVENLRKKVTNTFTFTDMKAVVKFSKEIKDGADDSRNQHIRTERPEIPRVLEQYVIYTSMEDLERVTVIAE